MKGLLLLSLAAAGLAAPVYQGTSGVEGKRADENAKPAWYVTVGAEGEAPEKAKREVDGTSGVVPAGAEGKAAEKAKRWWRGISWIVPAGVEGKTAA